MDYPSRHMLLPPLPHGLYLCFVKKKHPTILQWPMRWLCGVSTVGLHLLEPL